MKKALLIGAVSALCSTSAIASNCSDLTERNFIAVYGQQEPLSGIVSQALNNTGWKLNYTQISAEPRIKGEVKDPVESVIIGLVSESIKNDWKINLTFDRDVCQVNISVLNEFAPDTNTNLASKAKASPSTSTPALPVAAKIPKHVAKSVVSKNIYRVKKGELLRDVFHRWAQNNNGEAFWMVKNDEYKFRIGADAEFIGDLGGSVAGLMESIGTEGKKLNVRVFQNGYIRTEESGK